MNKTLEINELMIQRFETEYPSVDIRQEIKNMQNWWVANPKRRKKNEYRFVINWLNASYAKGIVAATQLRFANRDLLAGQYRGPHDEETRARHKREMEDIAMEYPELA
jgi:hypothetical protein